MKYSIITYGCQINKSDSERIATVLENIGYQPSIDIDKAGLIVVNACSVRQSAIDRIWGQVKLFAKLKMKNEKLKTILTGCVLKKDKKKCKEKFDLILDIKDLPNWPKYLLPKDAVEFLPWPKSNGKYLEIQPKYQSNFSAFVPIMTGCNNFCTFCVVPYTRGREISRPSKKIICEVKNLIKMGCKEIWLLGQNVNSYKFQEINFPNLLRMVNEVPGNFWIRFTSSHPKDFSEELINTMASCQKVTEYLNLPVQSGDNEILRRMNRPYTIEQYKEIVRKIREKIHAITLSTDVIVGFPGESEKQFQNTADLFKEIRYDMAYIAQYSPRPGTTAANLKDNVPHQEKERRWKILSGILKEIALEKNKQYLGKTLDVLVDYNPPTASSRLRRAPADQRGFLRGKTRTYKTVKFEGPQNLAGQFVKVKIASALPWGLRGKTL